MPVAVRTVVSIVLVPIVVEKVVHSRGSSRSAVIEPEMSANAERKICYARYVLKPIHLVVLRIFFQALHLARKIYIFYAVEKIRVALRVKRICPRIYFFQLFE